MAVKLAVAYSVFSATLIEGEGDGHSSLFSAFRLGPDALGRRMEAQTIDELAGAVFTSALGTGSDQEVCVSYDLPFNSIVRPDSVYETAVLSSTNQDRFASALRAKMVAYYAEK